MRNRDNQWLKYLIRQNNSQDRVTVYIPGGKVVLRQDTDERYKEMV